MTRGGYRKNAGRKPSPHSRRALLQARVHEGRPEAYREAAARAGMPLGEWIELHLDPPASATKEG